MDRLVRLVLPADLLAEVDAVIATRRSGYADLSAFVRDALEQRLLELTFPADVPSADRPVGRNVVVHDALPAVRAAREGVIDRWDEVRFGAQMADDLAIIVSEAGTPPRSLDDTRLVHAPAEHLAVADTTMEVERGQMFGIHNRDYPSLWALHWLARAADTGPVDLEDFRDTLTAAAWHFASGLRPLEVGSPLRLGIMFPRHRPTGRNRREASYSSSETFKVVAIGGVQGTRGGAPRAVGPLPAWGAMAISGSDDAYRVAVTRAGDALLRSLSGLSLDLPHAPERALAFLDHLREHHPADLAGFTTVLEVTSGGVDREALVSGYQDRFADLEITASTASTNAQGYVSRCREWGLMQPKLTDGLYRVTDLGTQVLKRYG